MRISYHKLLLLFGLAAFMLLAVYRLTDAYVGGLLNRLLVAAFFGGHWLYFSLKASRTGNDLDNRGLEATLKQLLAAAVAGLLLAASTALLKKSGGGIAHGFSGDILNLLSAYVVVLYFTYAANRIKPLVFYRPNKRVYAQRQFFEALLLAGAFFSLPADSAFYTAAHHLLLAAGVVALLPVFVMRTKWIALPQARNKLITVIYLTAILFATIGLMTATYATSMPGLLPIKATSHVSLVLLGFGMVGYLSFSILGIFFSLSLASVMAEQKREIEGYRKASEVLNNEEAINDSLERLFDICVENTQSESGWLAMYSNGAPQVQYMRNIDEKMISSMDDKLDFLQLNKKMPLQGYHHFPDLAQEPAYAGRQDTPYRSLLVLPVYNDKSEPACVLNLLHVHQNGFDAAAIEAASNFADQIKLAHKNTELVRQIIAGERYREEMEIARKVQEALLPQTFPATEYCQIAALAKAAGQVGGDYYDYCKIDEHRLAVIVGDVSGKGASAAFYMAQMKGIFQALMQLNLPADSFMIMANRAVSECMERNRFITALFVLLDFEENTFTYSRAGHCPMLYYDHVKGKAAYFRGEGLGLGIIRSDTYIDHVHSRELPLHEGDILLLYTDGIVEARKDDDAEQYGYERLKVCLESCAGQNAGQIRDAVYADVLEFTKGSNYVDDSTLMVVKITDLD